MFTLKRNRRPAKTKKEQQLWDEHGFIVDDKEQAPPKISVKRPIKEEDTQKKRHLEYTKKLVQKKEEREREMELLRKLSKETPRRSSRNEKDFESFMTRQNNSAKKHVEPAPEIDFNISHINKKSTLIAKRVSARKARACSVNAKSVVSSSAYQDVYAENEPDNVSIKSTKSSKSRTFRLVNVEQMECERQSRILDKTLKIRDQHTQRSRAQSVSSRRLKELSNPKPDLSRPKYNDADQLLEYSQKQWKPEAVPEYLTEIATLLPRDPNATPKMRPNNSAK